MLQYTKKNKNSEEAILFFELLHIFLRELFRRDIRFEPSVLRQL